MPFLNATKYPLSSTTFNTVPCVYGICAANGGVIYVGETEDLKRRISEHMADRTHAMHRYAPVSVMADVITAGEQARRLRERQLIGEYRPPANG